MLTVGSTAWFQSRVRRPGSQHGNRGTSAESASRRAAPGSWSSPGGPRPPPPGDRAYRAAGPPSSPARLTVLSEQQVERLRTVGHSGGLDLIGTCRAQAWTSVRDTLFQRRAAGIAGSMQFTYRNPSRSADPSRVFATARTLVVAARGYAQTMSAAATGSVDTDVDVGCACRSVRHRRSLWAARRGARGDRRTAARVGVPGPWS